MARRYIDWVKTGKKLEALRKRNENFIKKVSKKLENLKK